MDLTDTIAELVHDAIEGGTPFTDLVAAIRKEWRAQGGPSTSRPGPIVGRIKADKVYVVDGDVGDITM